MKTKINYLTLLFGATLGGCYNYSSNSLFHDLWDTDVVATQDAIYAILPSSGMLMKLSANGDFSEVDLQGASPTRLVASPDGSKLLVFTDYLECKIDDENIVYISDCPDNDITTTSELAVLSAGVVEKVYDIPSHLNTVSFSNDGSIVVAYLEYQSGSSIQVDGFADLGEVAFINLVDESQGSASVGFSPSQILFAPNNQAVVMSRSQIVVVDLASFQPVLEAPLTLDADQEVNPSEAELAYDPATGSVTLLLTVQNSSDLFMLDFETESWNIGDLGAIPTDIGVDASSSQSVFVFSNSSKAVVLDHSDLSTLNSASIEDIDLEEVMNSVIVSDGFSLLFNDSSNVVHDVYRLDMESRELVEYVVANPLYEMTLSQSGKYAVGLMKPESSYGSGIDAYQDARYGLVVLDMESDDVVNLVAETQPIGLEIVEGADGDFALVLLDGKDTLLQVNLANPSQSVEVDLPAAPIAIATQPVTIDGEQEKFIISHDVEIGMVSILDPKTLEIQTITGFGLAGSLSQPAFFNREEGE